jgi:hypothetical protein
MPRINRADGRFYSSVECHEPGMLGVGRLVERVVACDPWVIFVVLDKRRRCAGQGDTERNASAEMVATATSTTHLDKPLPQPNRPILEILILPEQRFVRPCGPTHQSEPRRGRGGARTGVAVPVGILSACGCVEVDDRVDSVSGALTQERRRGADGIEANEGPHMH